MSFQNTFSFFDKYLSEQRLAYLGTAAIIGVPVLTGLIKTYKNVYAPDLSHAVVFWATTLYNLFLVLFILFFVGHIGAILLKPNQPLARGIFTGAVCFDYARHRHPLWIAEFEKECPSLPDGKTTPVKAPVWQRIPKRRFRRKDHRQRRKRQRMRSLPCMQRNRQRRPAANPALSGTRTGGNRRRAAG